MIVSRLCALFAFIGFLYPRAYATYNQGEESVYIENFDSIIADSYSAISDTTAPHELLEECKNTAYVSNPIEEIIVKASEGNLFLSSSSVSSQCGLDSNCIIPAGITVTMDSNLNVASLVIRGSIVWNDETQSQNTQQWLCAGFVAVEENGKFDLDLLQPSGEKVAWIYIKDNLATHTSLRTRAFGAVSSDSSLYRPKIEISGRELKRTWSIITRPLFAGSSTISLMHDPVAMGWKINDRIAIASTKKLSSGDSQAFRITEFLQPGNKIKLSSPSILDHDATFGVAPSHAFLKAAEVINLSRNVIITGDDFRHIPCETDLPEAIPHEGTSTVGCRCSSIRTKCTVGLHTVQMHAGTQRIQNVRVEKCGQRGIEGKYCLHFHKIRECKECLFKNNAIEFSHQRGIIVHDTHAAKVDSNVLYDVRGANIYIEDGNEMYNNLQYNVIICPWKLGTHDSIKGGCSIPGTSNSQADTSINQSGIYTLTAANHIIGNRVSNNFNSMFFEAGHSGGNGRGEADGKVCQSNTILGRWEGNTFHSSGRFGTYTLGNTYPRNTGQSLSSNGYMSDQSLCSGFTSSGDDNGVSTTILNNFDYGNAFNGHYNAGDIQYDGHIAMDSNNLLYWKETKNFANGCSAHISNGYYKGGLLSLPDQGTFIIEDTTFDGDVTLEANHHCNIGITGVLCMPQYILHNVSWKSERESWVVFQDHFNPGSQYNQNHGGIFALSPSTSNTNFFPDTYMSLVSNKFHYLLSVKDDASNQNICSLSLDLGLGTRYDNGILCKVPLRSLKIYSLGLTKASSPASITVKVWKNQGNGIRDQIGTPLASQTIGYHQIGDDRQTLKQGYSIPVIPGSDYTYYISLGRRDNIPYQWIIEFSDPILSNRWDYNEEEERLHLVVEGRECGDYITARHDRRFIWDNDLSDASFGHGACTSYPKMLPATCQEDLVNDNINTNSCSQLCTSECSTDAYCDCGTEQCVCLPGFTGPFCEIDLCESARCSHGKCASKYLGGTLSVTNKACICEEPWSGPLCDLNPCETTGRTCSNHGMCKAVGDTGTYCDCDPGYSGDDCEVSCEGYCSGGNSKYPYGCNPNVPGTKSYYCGPGSDCYYSNSDEDTGPSGSCAFKTVADYQCTCESSDDCHLGTGFCNSDGSCPPPIQRENGIPCNSVSFGTCNNGACISQNTPNTPTQSPTSAPTKNESLTPSPTKTPTTAPISNRFVGSFDSTDKATYDYSSSTYEIATNPDSSGINKSSLIVKYARNPVQWDTIMYKILSISSSEVDEYINGNKIFCMDVLTSASQTALLQLEDSSVASPYNYPSGRHSRYTIDLQGSSNWQQYCFQLLDRPDSSTTIVDKLVLLFAPDTFTNNVYYFDNLDSFGEGITAAPTLAPTRSLTYNPTTKPPTKAPTLYPTHSPSHKPTNTPTISSTSNPTKRPTPLLISPTKTPTKTPTTAPISNRFVGSFDSTDKATYDYSSSTYEIATNPDSSGINKSSLIVKYARNPVQWDTIMYKILSISSSEVDEYINGNKIFCMDVLTSASQTALLQLEDSSVASPYNYPSGRHSRYTIDLQGSSNWQQYCFQLLDRPDSSTTIVDKLVLLFAPDTFTNNVYYFDNLDSFGEGITAAPTLAPTRSLTYNPTTKPPTKAPTLYPTHSPSHKPTNTPTISSTSNPTKRPTPLLISPTKTPTKTPTTAPISNRFVGSFDSTDKATYDYSSSTYEIATNPDSSGINKSSLIVKYARNPVQWDTIMYKILSISSSEVDEYINGNKIFCMDVLTSASQTALLQLEDSSVASPYNYPSGRHSRYTIDLQGSSNWQQYCFQLLDRPDSSTTIVDKLVLLFAPDTFTNNVYYFDNLDSFGEGITAAPTLAPTRSLTYNPTTKPPTKAPTLYPTHSPSHKPTNTPTISSTSNPTKRPTPLLISPTKTPTKTPTTAPISNRFVGSFDSTDKATYDYSSSTYEIATNPDSSGINKSSLIVKYARNPGSQWDTIMYKILSISSSEVDEYINGNKIFCMDVLTSASQTALLQLEDSSVASPYNYPSGRHSRYTIDLQGSSTWQQYCFQFLDRPDSSTTIADKLVLLFAPDTFTNNVYYFDNLDSFGEGITAAPTLAPTGIPTSISTFPPTKAPLPVVSPNPTLDITCPNLIWSDEFDGNTLDLDSWEVVIGDGCAEGICSWGNNELQWYLAENIKVGSGHLSMEAKKQTYRNKEYTSARLHSNVDFDYGYFEGKIRMPVGKGLWPAFWMLPSKDDAKWPNDGEIDIMEYKGHEPSAAHSTIHFTDNNDNHRYSGKVISLPNEMQLNDDFHMFSVEKLPGVLRFMFDGYIFFEVTENDIDVWPFDNNLFQFLLNVAVGGWFPGNPDSSTVFPQKMDVDYVRVYDNTLGAIDGPRSVINQEHSVLYSLNNGIEDYTYDWEVSVDAVIVSGQGTSSVQVNFGAETGYVSVIVSSPLCNISDQKFSIGVTVYSHLVRLVGNNDALDKATYSYATGIYSVEPNPDIDSSNSVWVSKYTRNMSEKWDSLVFEISSNGNDLDALLTGEMKFYIDLLTSASQQVILQLENSASTSLGWPHGRHSRYALNIQESAEWQKHLSFDFLDQPDVTVSSIDRILILFAPNTSTSDLYWFDNFDIYGMVQIPSSISDLN